MNEMTTNKEFFLISLYSGSYLQFRPISYTEESRDLSSQTATHLSEPVFLANPKIYLNSSLAWSYYGNLLSDSLVQSFNISFGKKEDGFYTHSNFTTW